MSITIYKINGKLFVDPTIQEEKAYDARLTVATDVEGKIYGIQKGGNIPLTLEDVDQMISLAIEKSS